MLKDGITSPVDEKYLRPNGELIYYPAVDYKEFEVLPNRELNGPQKIDYLNNNLDNQIANYEGVEGFDRYMAEQTARLQAEREQQVEKQNDAENYVTAKNYERKIQRLEAQENYEAAEAAKDEYQAWQQQTGYRPSTGYTASVQQITNPQTVEDVYNVELDRINQNYISQVEGLQTAYITTYSKAINDITNGILSQIGNLLNYEYDPSKDRALHIAQGYAVGRVKETMNATGMYYSSATQAAITKAVAELVPIYEKMAKEEVKTNIQMLQNLGSYLMNLEQMQFNMWKAQVDIKFKEAEMRLKEVDAAWDRVDNLGYVDNEASAILGIPAGTLSYKAKAAIQQHQWDLDAELRGYAQQEHMAEVTNELAIQKIQEQNRLDMIRDEEKARLDNWKSEQDDYRSYQYNSALKKEQYGYDYNLANQKAYNDRELENLKSANNINELRYKATTNNTSTYKTLGDTTTSTLRNAGFTEESLTNLEDILSGDLSPSEKTTKIKESLISKEGARDLLGEALADKNNDPLIASYYQKELYEDIDLANAAYVSSIISKGVIPELDKITFNQLGSDYEKTNTALKDAIIAADEWASIIVNTGYDKAPAAAADVYNQVIDKIENSTSFDTTKGNLYDNYTSQKKKAEDDLIKSIRKNENLGEYADEIANTVQAYTESLRAGNAGKADTYRDNWETNTARKAIDTADTILNNGTKLVENIVNSPRFQQAMAGSGAETLIGNITGNSPLSPVANAAYDVYNVVKDITKKTNKGG